MVTHTHSFRCCLVWIVSGWIYIKLCVTLWTQSSFWASHFYSLWLIFHCSMKLCSSYIITYFNTSDHSWTTSMSDKLKTAANLSVLYYSVVLMPDHHWCSSIFRNHVNMCICSAPSLFLSCQYEINRLELLIMVQIVAFCVYFYFI